MPGPAVDTSCTDWVRRLQRGHLPVNPKGLPLATAAAERFSEIYGRLVVPDILGQPLAEELPAQGWLDAVARALYGAGTIREAFVLIPKKQAKCLPLDTEIATPTGFATMRELRVGDEVLGPDGRPTQVVEKSPIFVGNDCYEVEFSTGEKIIADAGHRWWVSSHEDRDKHRNGDPCWRFRTTEDLAQRVRYYDGPRYHINNHRTALAQPLELPEAALPLDPYLLGAWLGDGSTTKPTLHLGRRDARHIRDRVEASGVACTVAERKTCVDISLTTAGTKGETIAILRHLGVLGDKHIPRAYLRASRDQRLHLLQGLMDTDGSFGGKNVVVYSTTTRALADGVAELASTLGFKAYIEEGRANLGGVDYGPHWRVKFTAYADDDVFTVPFKAARLVARPERLQRSGHRQIVAIREVASMPTQCIRVASTTEQFLLGRSMIPTGNTSGGALMLLAAFLLNRVHGHRFSLLAPTVSIASFAFDQIVNSIEADPELAAKTRIRRHVREIDHIVTGAMILVKPASLAAVTGLKGSVFVDELHVWGAMREGQRLRQQLKGALAANPAAKGLYITTQSDDEPAGLFRNMLAYARGVRDGRIEDPSFLPVLIEPWPGCDPWRDESVWPKLLPAYPHIAGPEFYRSVIAEAESSGPTAVAEAKSQYFNVEIGRNEAIEAWMVAQRFDRLTEPMDLDDLLERSQRVSIGIDLGGAYDLTSLVALGVDADDRWLVWCRGWLTEVGMDRNKRNQPRFAEFIDAGDLVVCGPGDDVAEVTGICERAREAGKLVGVGVDPAGAADLADALEATGFVMDEDLFGIGQTSFRLAPAVRSLERRVDRRAIVFADQGLMAWALGNVVVQQKGNSPQVSKETALDRVDPVFACLDAVTVEIAHRPETIDVGAMVA